MSTTKVVAGVAGVVAFLAVGSALYQTHAAHESAAALSASNLERAALQSRFAASEKREHESGEALAAVRKELSDLRAQPPSPAPAPAKASGSKVAPAMEYVLDHPELQATQIQQQTLRAKIRYERFIKGAGLSAAQQEQFFKALEDAFTAELDVMAVLHDKGYSGINLPTDPRELALIGQLNREYKGKWRTDMKAALGEDGFRKYEQYTSLLPERNVAEAVASQVYDTDSPLTAAQAEQLAQILKEHPLKAGEPSADNTMGGDYVLTSRAASGRAWQVAPLGGMTSFDTQNPITDAALAQARSILNPAQFAALQRLQAQQVTQFQLAPPAVRPSPGK